MAEVVMVVEEEVMVVVEEATDVEGEAMDAVVEGEVVATVTMDIVTTGIAAIAGETSVVLIEAIGMKVVLRDTDKMEAVGVAAPLPGPRAMSGKVFMGIRYIFEIIY